MSLSVPLCLYRCLCLCLSLCLCLCVLTSYISISTYLSLLALVTVYPLTFINLVFLPRNTSFRYWYGVSPNWLFNTLFKVSKSSRDGRLGSDLASRWSFRISIRTGVVVRRFLLPISTPLPLFFYFSFPPSLPHYHKSSSRSGFLISANLKKTPCRESTNADKNSNRNDLLPTVNTSNYI